MKISQTSTSSVRRLLSDTVNKRRVVYQKSLRSASSIPPLESSEEDLEQLFKAHTELQNQTWTKTKTKTKTRPREIKLLSKRNATGKNEFLDYKSPKEIKYPGDVKLSIASKLNIVLPSEHPPQTPWPVFRLLVSIFLTFATKCFLKKSFLLKFVYARMKMDRFALMSMKLISIKIINQKTTVKIL